MLRILLFLTTMKTILVPIDLSEVTQSICDAACTLAKLTKSRLVILHMVEPPPLMVNEYYALNTFELTNLISAGEKAAARKLLALGARCRKKVRHVQTVQRTGDATSGILEKARNLKPDYIVMGSHGRSAMYDLLVGSTTHGILRKAACPIVIVPSRPAKNRKR